MFPLVPHKDVVNCHHLEVGPFPANFGFLSVPGPFMRAYEEHGFSREVVDILYINVVNFHVLSSRSRMMLPMPLVLIIPFTLLTSVF